MFGFRLNVTRSFLLIPVALTGLAACGRAPRPETLILENHHELFVREHELTARYAADLEVWLEQHAEADDAARAGVELIRTLGVLGDVAGAERYWRLVRSEHPGDTAVPAAGLEMAEAALANAATEAALRVISTICTDAHGYAYQTRLVQNLATLLALEGRLAEAREAYDLIRDMELYTEYPARFRSLEIFLDYLDRVGTEFPPLVGTAADGTSLDTGDFRGQPLFLHFWRRRGSLNHDLEFLEDLQHEYPDLAVVSINVGDEPEAVRQALLKHVPHWPFWHDRDGSYAASLGITFMGLYVHEPKGILLDSEGRIAVMPGREGAIAIGLKALDKRFERFTRPAALPRPSETVTTAAGVLELQQSHTRALLAVRDRARADLLTALGQCVGRDLESEAGARACLELLRTAAAGGNVAAAEEAWALWQGDGEQRGSGPVTAIRETYAVAMDFAYARAMLTCGDPERTAGLVDRAIGERQEREDLYLLCDLAAALSVLGDVDGARRAFEKIIEITGGAGSAAWEGYIAALDRVGHPLEPFTLPGLNGGTVASSDYAGRLLLIDFWGSWCHACIREMPHAYEAWNRYHERGFEVLGIVVRDTREKARAFLERTGYPWDQAFDADSSVAGEHVVVGYPTTILVDGSGRVRCTRTFGGGLEIALRLLIER